MKSHDDKTNICSYIKTDNNEAKSNNRQKFDGNKHISLRHKNYIN